MRFTRSNIAGLEIGEGKTERIIFDDSLAGFGLRMRAGGKRTWIAQYRVGAKQRRISFGTTETLDVDEARKRARDILAKVQLGADPQGEKAEARSRASVTLGAVATHYLAHAKTRLRASSFSEAERHLTRHWAPLRTTPAHDLTRRHVAVRLSEIAAENGPHAANRARASLSAMFTWAMRQGEVDSNPVAATGKPAENVARTRVLSDDEICDVWNACRDDDHGRIVRLLLLTGQRRTEVGAMRWSEIDRPRKLWQLPPERTKNGLPHTVPLSPAALAIIETVPVRGGRDFLFGDSTGPFQGWSKSKMNLDRRISEKREWLSGKPDAGISEWRLHDLRRTAVTHMNEHLRILPHVVEAIVNHITGPAKMGVAGIYNRATYADEKRDALNKWAEYLTGKLK
ncbi:site-specific integrase [Methylobacterium sp. E-025]|uniref:tyrosine-type recombinase/integrase n=1 Tax=Methylobacterium sp. E-025 TaxID=2836561 RepID=UPI001FB9677A|nr:site-specific integrase [Methylobacterium sp. E-025]MCJ2110758.1 site-specific integrase [Methylobacterium sp. E-025]